MLAPVKHLESVACSRQSVWVVSMLAVMAVVPLDR